jgi:hypothetical protein
VAPLNFSNRSTLFVAHDIIAKQHAIPSTSFEAGKGHARTIISFAKLNNRHNFSSI